MYEKIFLASLGTYARYEKLGKEGSKLFDELVEEGETVNDRTTSKLDEYKTKAKDKLQDQLDKLKDLLKLEDNKDEIAELSAQVEALSLSVKALTVREVLVREEIAQLGQPKKVVARKKIPAAKKVPASKPKVASKAVS